MKSSLQLLTICALLIAVCSAQNVLCPKIRTNKICNGVSDPVCGIKHSSLQGSNGINLRATFKSFCDACNDSTVEFYAAGPCEAYDTKGTFCSPAVNYKNVACTDDYTPVCGNVGSIYLLCMGGPCVNTFSNGCNACVSNALFYVPGSCGGSSTIEE